MDTSADECREFSAHYLPDLYNYVVAVVEGQSVGSGVLVKAGDRHFVATARHCIKNKPRVLQSVRRMGSGTVEAADLRVLGTGWHEALDLGYLEIADPRCAEITWEQLSTKAITGGMVQIVGYPENLHRPDYMPKTVIIQGAAFATTLREATDESLLFDYPKAGALYDQASGQWVPSDFPETPRGFSGGGCFGVSKADVGALTIPQYWLLGIQCRWSRTDRYVRVVPIKQWFELLKRQGCTTPSLI